MNKDLISTFAIWGCKNWYNLTKITFQCGLTESAIELLMGGVIQRRADVLMLRVIGVYCLQPVLTLNDTNSVSETTVNQFLWHFVWSEGQVAVREWFEKQPKTCYLCGMRKIMDHWTISIENTCSYVTK